MWQCFGGPPYRCLGRKLWVLLIEWGANQRSELIQWLDICNPSRQEYILQFCPNWFAFFFFLPLFFSWNFYAYWELQWLTMDFSASGLYIKTSQCLNSVQLISIFTLSHAVFHIYCMQVCNVEVLFLVAIIFFRAANIFGFAHILILGVCQSLIPSIKFCHVTHHALWYGHEWYLKICG